MGGVPGPGRHHLAPADHKPGELVLLPRVRTGEHRLRWCEPGVPRPGRGTPAHGGALAPRQASYPGRLHAVLPCDPMACLPVPHMPACAPRCPPGPARPADAPLRVRHAPAHESLARGMAGHPVVPALRRAVAGRRGRGTRHPGSGVRGHLRRQDPIPVRLAQQPQADRAAGRAGRQLPRRSFARAGEVRSRRYPVRPGDGQDLDQRPGHAQLPASRGTPVGAGAPVRCRWRAFQERAAAGCAPVPRRRPGIGVRPGSVLGRRHQGTA